MVRVLIWTVLALLSTPTTLALFDYTRYAVCNVTPDPNYSGDKGSVSGRVLFRQRMHIFAWMGFGFVSWGFVTDVDVQLSGFTASGEGDHGFHIHTYGDLTKGCISCGGHFNPYEKEHGGPSDSNRHVGDLGNIKVSGSAVNISFTDNKISLCGTADIIGRAVVVHENRDDLGRGGYPDSKTTGHAGARMACCTIGMSDGSEWSNI